ncbi:hypothetical protein [Flavobacterium sp.]|uniref:hypothetical protein n=1 Tax=Flavobacterium sp. TaxID=239 RepID=UPI00286D8A59|nr:hypothetical protein [Flavobacterium sp.]
MRNDSVSEFKLVEGEFNATEALNILMSLFNSKIDYHQLDSFSNHIRHGADMSFSKNRIQVLSQSIDSIKEIVKEANSKGKKLKIDGIIQISLVE